MTLGCLTLDAEPGSIPPRAHRGAACPQYQTRSALRHFYCSLWITHGHVGALISAAVPNVTFTNCYAPRTLRWNPNTPMYPPGLGLDKQALGLYSGTWLLGCVANLQP